MKPIVPPLYDVGFIIKNCNMQLLEALEPWCSTMYIDDWLARNEYINIEQSKTSFHLGDKIRPYDNEKDNHILVEIDGSQFGNEDFKVIQSLSEILANDEQLWEAIIIEPTHFTIENLHVTIISLQTYERGLIWNE